VAASVTVLALAAAPSTSMAFWTDALLDPSRLGPNAGTSNQSLRGALMRLVPGATAVQSMLWLACAVVVATLGFALSARLDRLGEQVAVVGAVGMVAVLISPVSWIHHWHWAIAVIGALVGDGRVRSRVAAALAVTAVMLLPLPWWGGAWSGWGVVGPVTGRIVEQSYTLLAIGALLALWRLVAVPAAGGAATATAAGSSRSPAAAPPRRAAPGNVRAGRRS
jgi:alpha-1,2-mannosyltransferase